MPIYTYECPNGHRWDEQRRFTDPEVEVSEGYCPKGCTDACDCTDRCCSLIGERVWDPGDMRPVFKGRGWARKDHKDASKP